MENRIDEVMNSLDGLQSAEMPPFLFTRIQQKMANRAQQITARAIWRVSISLVLVIALNVAVAVSYRQSQQKPTGKATINDFSSEYFGDNTYSY